MKGISISQYKSIHSLNHNLNYKYFSPRKANTVYYGVERYAAYARTQNAVAQAKSKGKKVPRDVKQQMLGDLEEKSRVIRNNKVFQMPTAVDRHNFDQIAKKDSDFHKSIELSEKTPIKYEIKTNQGHKKLLGIDIPRAKPSLGENRYIDIDRSQFPRLKQLGVKGYLHFKTFEENQQIRRDNAREKRRMLRDDRLHSDNNTKDKYVQIDKAYVFKGKNGHHFVSFKGAFVAGPHKNHYMTNQVRGFNKPYVSHYTSVSGQEWNHMMKLSHNKDLVLSSDTMEGYAQPSIDEFGNSRYKPLVISRDKAYITKAALLSNQEQAQAKLLHAHKDQKSDKYLKSNQVLRQNEHSLRNTKHPSALRNILISAAYVVGRSNSYRHTPIVAVAMKGQGKDKKYHYLINSRFSNGSINHFQFMPSTSYSTLLKNSDNKKYLKLKHPYSTDEQDKLVEMSQPKVNSKGQKSYPSLIDPGQDVALRAPLHHWNSAHAYLVFPSSVKPSKQKMMAKEKEREKQSSLSRYYKLPSRQEREENMEFNDNL